MPNDNLPISGHIKRAFEKADKYARGKRHICLFPGCNATTNSNHSIQSALCSSALAENGELYTIRHSFMPRFKRSAPASWLEIIKEGVNDAGTFQCYCSKHDNLLFAAAETETKKVNDRV